MSWTLKEVQELTRRREHESLSQIAASLGLTKQRVHQILAKRREGPKVKWTPEKVHDLAERREHESLSQIAASLGLTRQRIHQILVTHGYQDTGETLRKRRRIDVENTRMTQQAAIRAAITKNPAIPLIALSEETGVPLHRIRGVAGREWMDAHYQGVRPYVNENHYSDEEIHQALLRVKGPFPSISRSWYDGLRQPYEPTSTALIYRFGTWNEALTHFGLPTTAPVRDNYRQMSRDDVLNAVREYLDTGQRSASGYSRWASANGKPALNTVRRHGGRWSALVAGLL